MTTADPLHKARLVLDDDDQAVLAVEEAGFENALNLYTIDSDSGAMNKAFELTDSDARSPLLSIGAAGDDVLLLRGYGTPWMEVHARWRTAVSAGEPGGSGGGEI